MGRPLNKKYFGNRNIGTGGAQITGPNSNNQNYADDRIGGEGIDHISFGTLGSFRGNNGAHNPLVGMSLPAPTIPGGVQATWTVTLEVESVTTGAGSVGLVVGETYTYAGLGSPLFTVATSSNNGTNATFTVTNRGSVDLGSLPGDTTTVSITRVTGGGAATFTVDINFRVKTAVINEKGSGYTGDETMTVTLYPGAVGTAPTPSIVLTDDTGNVGSATNQENAIIIHANVGGEGGTLVGDIIRQISTRRYKVKTADGIGIVELTDDDTPSSGYAYIKATDTNGNTYYVMKLTSRLAVLKHWYNNESSWVVDDDGRAHWTFSESDPTYNMNCVVIENA